MSAHVALIERSNRKDLNRVEVQMTLTEPGAGGSPGAGNSSRAAQTGSF